MAPANRIGGAIIWVCDRFMQTLAEYEREMSELLMRGTAQNDCACVHNPQQSIIIEGIMAGSLKIFAKVYSLMMQPPDLASHAHHPKEYV